MKNILPSSLLEATRLTREGRLADAVTALQHALGGEAAPNSTDARRDGRGPPTIDGTADNAATEAPAPRAGWPMLPKALPRVLSGVLPQALRDVLDRAGQGGAASSAPASAADSPASSARFLDAAFSNPAGSRPYKLYVPGGYRPGQPAPLVVMLHGCTQSPDDFAAGTRMNEAAERLTCLVVYPAQVKSANAQRCWNWFSAADQARDAGEPSLIAGITREVMREYAVDPRRVYVAGLSAGGAAAAVMGDAYPDLYAAIGVHSGLACGAARDMPSAFAAMQRGHEGAAPRPRAGRRTVPAIVFHGDRDTTVSPRNGDAVVAQAAHAAALTTRTERGQAPGGHAYARTLHADAAGQVLIEQWSVQGAGHAWSGGSAAGSYTDPRGPDASGEMLRFFLEHPHPAAAPAA